MTKMRQAFPVTINRDKEAHSFTSLCGITSGKAGILMEEDFLRETVTLKAVWAVFIMPSPS